MSNGFFARAVVVSLLGLAGMSLGCSDSPSSPTLTPTPAAPASPPIGFTLTSVSPSSGPTLGGDYVRVFGTGFQSDTTVMLDGFAAQVTKITDTRIDARTLAHARGPVDLVVTNPDGKSATLKAGFVFVELAEFSVMGSPNLVAPGGELTVSWVAPSGRGCNGGGDWIALYKVGDPDQTTSANGHSDIWYDHVCGATSGSWKLKAPVEPGQYDFRFMVGDYATARSNPITVGG